MKQLKEESKAPAFVQECRAVSITGEMNDVVGADAVARRRIEDELAKLGRQHTEHLVLDVVRENIRRLGIDEARLGEVPRPQEQLHRDRPPARLLP